MMLIGERMLTLRLDGSDIQVPVRIYAPEKRSNKGWLCRYYIGWPDDEKQSEGWGYDALQALFLTLQKIGVDIYMSAYHASGRLCWVPGRQGYGFPVPRDARNLLVGDDARFEG